MVTKRRGGKTEASGVMAPAPKAKKRGMERKLPRPFAFEWGNGQIVEEATMVGPYHAPAIQLLEYDDGGRSIRFCYYDHAGRFKRSPLMVREDDLKDLRAALRSAPRLRAMLRRIVA